MKESSKESKERKKVVVVEALTATTTCAGAGAREYPTQMAKLEKMATMAAESDFLNGGGQRGFKADMEWLTREANFLKVLNGKYGNIPEHRRWRDHAAERAAAQAKRWEQVREIEREEHERRMREREEWAKGAVTYEEYRRMVEEERVEAPEPPKGER